MTCPECNSELVGETDKFDLTDIGPEEVIHDFECHACGCLFIIRYKAYSASVITSAHR